MEEEPKVMKGRKTWAAVIGTFLSGVTIVIAAFGSNPIDAQLFIEGVLVILGSVALLGLGHKFEKAVATVIEVLKQLEKPKE